MTKKRTTIYLDEESQKIIENIQMNLDETQTDVIKKALAEYYFSESYEIERERAMRIKKSKHELNLNKI